MFIEQTSRYKVAKMYPNAIKIRKVCCGFKVFFCYNDYLIWSNQK